MARWRLFTLSLVLALYLLLAASSSVFASTTIAPITTNSAQPSFSSLSPSPTVTATSTPTVQSSSSNGNLSIWPAFAGVILAALIGAGSVIYSNQRNAKLQEKSIKASVVPQLMNLLSQKQVDSSVRADIAYALCTLADDTNTVYTLALLLKDSDIANTIYSALWKICRRMKVRVYVTDDQTGSHIEVVPIEDTLS